MRKTSTSNLPLLWQFTSRIPKVEAKKPL